MLASVAGFTSLEAVLITIAVCVIAICTLLRSGTQVAHVSA